MEAAPADSSLQITPYLTGAPVASLTNALQAANSGITILSSSLIAADNQSGTYSSFTLPSSTPGQPTITAPDGILLTTGSANLPHTNTSSSFTTQTNTGSNAQLSGILTAAGAPSSTTYDQNVLTLTFTVKNPTDTSVKANFVYGSDEYPDQGVTDIFGFFVDGKNYAAFSDGSLVGFQEGKTTQFFNDNNTTNGYALEYDGISNLLTVTGLLDSGTTTHTLTIAIADTSDSIFDSGAFIGALQAGTGAIGGVVAAATIDTTNGDIAPNVFSLASPAATASTVEFDGGILSMTGGSFAGNIITAPVTLSASNGTVDTTPADGGFSGVVSGPGSLTVTGTHTFSLSGANTYSGGTILAGGTLQVGSSSALGTGTLTFSPATSGGSPVLQAGAQDLTIANAMVLAADGTIDTQDFALATTGTIGGTSHLTKTGAGALALIGANTYSGGTSVLSGTLAVGTDTALGTGLLSLDNGTTLEFLGDGIHLANPIALSGTLDPVIDTGDGSQTISGPITGPGALTKIGAGTLDLTGTNTYTGATEIAAGTLLVDGSVVNSAVTVDSGAFLGGSGSIKSVVVNAGATLNLAAQTLSVTASATFLAGSTYQVSINPDGTGSKLSVGGVASLGGATLAVLTGDGTYTAKTYTLLTAAGGVSGTFGTVDTPSNLALLHPQVSYGANDIVLTLNPVDFKTVAATPNQAAAAGAIQALGTASPLYDAVVPLDRAGAQQAFTATSGVSNAAPTSIVASINRLSSSLLLDRLWDVTGSGLSAQQVLDQFAPDRLPALVRCYGPGPDPVPAPRPPSYTAWGEAFGTFGHTNGGANAGPLDRTLGGFILGLDTPFQGILDDKWRGGVAVGYTNTSYTSHIDGGTGTLQGVFGSLYAGARYGAVDLRVGTTVGGNFIDGRRTVAFPGFLENEKSSSDGYSVQAFGEVGYRIPANGFVFEPVAGLSFLHSHQNGFSEKGGAAALTVGAVDNDLGTTSVGFRTEMQPFKDLPIIAHAFLAWQHVIGNLSPAATLAFESAPAGTFSITGTPIDRDALAAELAMDYRVSTALDVGLSYTGQVGPTAYDHSVKGRFEYRF